MNEYRLCTTCTEDLLIAYAGNEKVEARYQHKIYEGGKCDICKHKFRELTMYKVVKRNV